MRQVPGGWYVAWLGLCGVFALTACDSETSTASSDVSRLGSPVKVSASSGLYSDEFAGTVNVDSGPVCAAAKGARVVVFHVRASAEKGKVPTGNWRLQTGNATPVTNASFDLGDFAGPLLGSPVESDHAWGDIAFVLPVKTVATRLQLFAGEDRYSGTPGRPLAQWATPTDIQASVSCPAPLQAAIASDGSHQ